MAATVASGGGPVAEQRRFESKDENKIEVPERPGRYHPLVQQIRVALQSPEEAGRAGDPVPCFGIDVSRNSRRRALRIMDTLMKALESRGMGVSLDSARGRTLVDVRGVAVAIHLEERHKQVEVRSGWPAWKRVGTGRLALKIDSWSRDLRWTRADGKKQRVENCLNSFIVGVVAFAEVEREYERKRQEREQEEREQRRRIEEERRRERLEHKRVTEIRQQAADWDEAERLRAYVAAVRSALAEPDGSFSDSREAWLTWAVGNVERLDPLTELSANKPKKYAPEVRERAGTGARSLALFGQGATGRAAATRDRAGVEENRREEAGRRRDAGPAAGR